MGATKVVITIPKETICITNRVTDVHDGGVGGAAWIAMEVGGINEEVAAGVQLLVEWITETDHQIDIDELPWVLWARMYPVNINKLQSSI